MDFNQEYKKAGFEAAHAPLTSRATQIKISCPGFFPESHVLTTEHAVYYVGVDGELDVEQNAEYARLVKTFESQYTPGAGSVFIPGAFAGNLVIVNQKKVCIVQ